MADFDDFIIVLLDYRAWGCVAADGRVRRDYTPARDARSDGHGYIFAATQVLQQQSAAQVRRRRMYVALPALIVVFTPQVVRLKGLPVSNMRIEVLLVEDNPGDARLAMEIFRHINKAVRLHVVTEGIEAMDFLRQQGAYALAPRPVLILLDLNLPKMDGLEILTIVKQDAGLKSIPIVILTTSDAASDVSICYQMHANCYLVKPVRLEMFENLVRTVNDFWLNTATLMSTVKR